MGLFQAHDLILAGMGVVIVHFLLLAVNNRDYGIMDQLSAFPYIS